MLCKKIQIKKLQIQNRAFHINIEELTIIKMIEK